jgi:heterodisulfide reductase subunit A
VVILYRDIRTYGLREDYYKQARDLGVIFVRYEVDKKPVVESAGDRLRIKTWDYILNKDLVVDADWLVLSTGLRPHPTTGRVGEMYKITRNPDGYFLEAHVKLRPVSQVWLMRQRTLTKPLVSHWPQQAALALFSLKIV